MSKLESLFKDFQKAIGRLEEILEKRKNKINRDSAIKRFEMAFDLSWKTVKTFLEEEKGMRCASPKECFREAYRQDIIDYDEFWMKMSDWRNKAVHTYSEKFADILYKKLPEALKYFQILEEKIH